MVKIPQLPIPDKCENMSYQQSGIMEGSQQYYNLCCSKMVKKDPQISSLRLKLVSGGYLHTEQFVGASLGWSSITLEVLI